MGCLCSKSGEHALALAVQIEIDASSDIVWDVVTDLEALPETVPFVQSVEMLNFDGKVTVGTKWRETRQVAMDKQDNIINQIKTVVRVEEKEQHPRSLCVNVSFPKKDNDNSTEDIANTCSWTVQPMSDDKTVLICSIAFDSPAQGWQKCCGKMMLRYAEKYLLEELKGYQQAALKRQQAQQT